MLDLFEHFFCLLLGISMAGLAFGMCVLTALVQYVTGEYGWRGGILILSGLTMHIIVGGAVMRPMKIVVVDEQDIEENEDEALAKKMLSEYEEKSTIVAGQSVRTVVDEQDQDIERNEDEENTKLLSEHKCKNQREHDEQNKEMPRTSLIYKHTKESSKLNTENELLCKRDAPENYDERMLSEDQQNKRQHVRTSGSEQDCEVDEENPNLLSVRLKENGTIESENEQLSKVEHPANDMKKNSELNGLTVKNDCISVQNTSTNNDESCSQSIPIPTVETACDKPLLGDQIPNGKVSKTKDTTDSSGSKICSPKKIFHVEIFREPFFIIFCTNLFLSNIAISIFYTFVPAMAMEYGSSASTGGNLIAISGVVGLFARIAIGSIANFGKVHIYLLNSILMLLFGVLMLQLPFSFST